VAEQSCYVYVQLPDTFEPVPCALLRVRELGAGVFEGTFTYGRRYLERPGVVSLDPYHLPLTPAPQRFTKLKGIPGAVRDASPDAWGRRVIQAKLQRPEVDIDEVEYLLSGPDDGAGWLSFGRTVTPPASRRPFNRTHQFQVLIDAAAQVEIDGRLPHEVLEQLEPGTSMGGARPKATIEDADKLWLAKLPERADRIGLQRIEYATLELARAAGLRVCSTRIEPLAAGREVLMLERFDRVWNPEVRRYARLGLVSGLTVLDAEDGYTGRSRWSYPLLADELRRWSHRPVDDRLELFRRMVFNAMVTNNDDHPRNHALVRTSSGWRLSPAYDIVPAPMVSRERRDLALEVGAFGRSASVYNLLSRCEVFGLEREAARALMDGMLGVIRGWRAFFSAHGVTAEQLAYLEAAMLPDSFFLEEPADPV